MLVIFGVNVIVVLPLLFTSNISWFLPIVIALSVATVCKVWGPSYITWRWRWWRGSRPLLRLQFSNMLQETFWVYDNLSSVLRTVSHNAPRGIDNFSSTVIGFWSNVGPE